MIIFSLVVSIILGNVEATIKTLFESTNDAIKLCVGISGVLCLWSGFMKIAEKSGFVKYLAKLLKPIIKILFAEEYNDDQISGYIGLNMASNILGIGNVATPIGIRAMEKLQEKNRNKETLSNSMLMFLVLNTASIQIIPMTVIALRSNCGSQNPASIVIPTIISSVVSVIFGIIIVKVIQKREKE